MMEFLWARPALIGSLLILLPIAGSLLGFVAGLDWARACALDDAEDQGGETQCR